MEWILMNEINRHYTILSDNRSAWLWMHILHEAMLCCGSLIYSKWSRPGTIDANCSYTFLSYNMYFVSPQLDVSREKENASLGLLGYSNIVIPAFKALMIFHLDYLILIFKKNDS